MRRKLKETQNLGKTVYVVSGRIGVGWVGGWVCVCGGGRGGGTLQNYFILVGFHTGVSDQTMLFSGPLFQTFSSKSLKSIHVFRAGIVTPSHFESWVRSQSHSWFIPLSDFTPKKKPTREREHQAIKELKNNPEINIKRADKGFSVVVFNKRDKIHEGQILELMIEKTNGPLKALVVTEPFRTESTNLSSNSTRGTI